MSRTPKTTLDLRKQILITLYDLNRELSYDELVDTLEIKVRKRLTDSMTILRKNMWVSQSENGVKIAPLGLKSIENFLVENQSYIKSKSK